MLGKGGSLLGRSQQKTGSPEVHVLGLYQARSGVPADSSQIDHQHQIIFFFVCVIHCCSSNLVMQQDYLLVFYSSAS